MENMDTQHSEEMTEDERAEIERQLGGFRSFIDKSEHNMSLFASLVIVNDLAYTDYTNIRVRRFSTIDPEADPSRSTFSQAPEMIASLAGFDARGSGMFASIQNLDDSF